LDKVHLSIEVDGGIETVIEYPIADTSGVLEQLELRKMLSSYQRLKFKKDLAVKVADELKEDIEFIIMRPHSKRAKAIRREVKEKNNG
jgi:hypothetical protein